MNIPLVSSFSQVPATCAGVDGCGSTGPSVNLELDDRIVIYKPAGWEVERTLIDGKYPETVRHKQLSWFLRALYSRRQYPLAYSVRRHFGFLHRLDVPNSGLVLAAKTMEAYYDLRWQFSTGKVHRDYIVLCHGFVSPEISDLRGSLYSPPATRLGRSPHDIAPVQA